MNKMQDELFWWNNGKSYIINLIQFLPYFPPHKWGLETVAEELWNYYAKNNYWEVLNPSV